MKLESELKHNGVHEANIKSSRTVRGQMLEAEFEAKDKSSKPRPRTKFWPRGQPWPRGLNITGYTWYIKLLFVTFYRAMHFSAKRGIAIACRLSDRLSVTLVDCDRIDWNTSRIISPLVNLGCSLSADPNIIGLLQGEHPKIWVQSDPPLLI